MSPSLSPHSSLGPGVVTLSPSANPFLVSALVRANTPFSFRRSRSLPTQCPSLPGQCPHSPVDLNFVSPGRSSDSISSLGLSVGFHTACYTPVPSPPYTPTPPGTVPPAFGVPLPHRLLFSPPACIEPLPQYFCYLFDPYPNLVIPPAELVPLPRAWWHLYNSNHSNRAAWFDAPQWGQQPPRTRDWTAAPPRQVIPSWW